ncbi:MAG: DUF5343 domain-containing protein [Gammaproteobacteria bacterium]
MDEYATYMNSSEEASFNAGVTETFNKDFFIDLGFTSSYDTALIKVLRYLGILDSSNKPQDPYRQFVDQSSRGQTEPP